jgi:hypothetical protein
MSVDEQDGGVEHADELFTWRGSRQGNLLHGDGVVVSAGCNEKRKGRGAESERVDAGLMRSEGEKRLGKKVRGRGGVGC